MPEAENDSFTDMIKFLIVLLAISLLVALITNAHIWRYPQSAGGFIYNYQNLLAGICAVIGGASVLIAARLQSIASIKEKWLYEFKNDLVAFIELTSSINDILTEAGKLLDRINKIAEQIQSIPEGTAARSELKMLLEETKSQESAYHSSFEAKKAEANGKAFSIKLFLNLDRPSHKKLIEEIHNWNMLSKNWEDLIFDNNQSTTNYDEQQTQILQKMYQKKAAIIDAAKIIISSETYKLTR